MCLFDYENYREIVVKQVKSSGRGGWAQLATTLRLHPSHISQVFRGARNLSEEQGLKLAEHYKFSELETRYFIALIKLERSGSENLRIFYRAELDQIREQSRQVSAQIDFKVELTESQRAFFYSSWRHSAIRLLAARPEGITKFQLCDALAIQQEKLESIVERLVDLGLLKVEGDVISTTERRTHIPAHDPIVGNHHRNWRAQTATKLDEISDEELAFTGPMIIGQGDLGAVKKEILQCLGRINKIVDSSGSDTLACLNIDFTKLTSVAENGLEH